MPRGSPVSVYLFPGEAPKHGHTVLQGDNSDLDRLVTMATEAQADMMSEEGSEGSTDNDDFCILEAPGMGIPVRLISCLTSLSLPPLLFSCAVFPLYVPLLSVLLCSPAACHHFRSKLNAVCTHGPHERFDIHILLCLPSTE